MEIDVSQKPDITAKKARYGCPLAPLNIFWLISQFIKEIISNRKLKREEILKSCSEAIDYLPKEVKSLLTIVTKKRIITPQQNFLYYFEDAEVLCRNSSEFIAKFAEIYKLNEKNLIINTKKAKISGDKDFAIVFGKPFEILFKDYRRERSVHLFKYKFLFVRLIQFFRSIGRFMFSSLY